MRQYMAKSLVLDKAKVACQQSGQPVADHFAEMRKMVEIGSGAQREVEDLRFSRYVCYLRRLGYGA